MPLNVGDGFGHYDVTVLIGEGGMGESRHVRPRSDPSASDPTKSWLEQSCATWR